jgi:hypothetical protein
MVRSVVAPCIRAACELRFHSEAYGWEVQCLEREIFASRGGFPLRGLAVKRAEEERKTLILET